MPAARTYEPIATTTLGSTATSYTFTSIPQTYTDIVLISNVLPASDARVKLRVNSDSSSNYSYTSVAGNGSITQSGRVSSYTELDLFWLALPSGWSTYISNFQNYSNTTTFKTILNRGNSPAVETTATVGLWRSTSAISSIQIFTNAGNFAIGTTFTLYGITAA